MMQKLVSLGRGLLVLLALPLSTGCFGRFERPRIPAVIAPSSAQKASYTLEAYNKDLDDYGRAIDPKQGDAAEAMRLRNKMIYGLMAEIDYVYYDYETRLFLNQGTFRVGSDFVQLGLAAGATVNNGARGKTVLNALLSGTTGLSLSVDKNFFRQQTLEAIASNMEAGRDATKTMILKQLKQDVTSYPFQAARGDLIKYFFAGTLPGGLHQLHQQAAAEAQRQSSDLNSEKLVADVSKADATNAAAVNAAISAAFQKNDLTKVRQFLKEMNVSIAGDATPAAVEAACRELGLKVSPNAALRKQFIDAAKKVGLIQ